MTLHQDLTGFLEDAQLDYELDEIRARRTERLDDINATFSRADASFFAARRPVFEDWRRESRDAETRYIQRKLRDTSVSRFPGLGDLLSGALVARSRRDPNPLGQP